MLRGPEDLPEAPHGDPGLHGRRGYGSAHARARSLDPGLDGCAHGPRLLRRDVGHPIAAASRRAIQGRAKGMRIAARRARVKPVPGVDGERRAATRPAAADLARLKAETNTDRSPWASPIAMPCRPSARRRVATASGPMR